MNTVAIGSRAPDFTLSQLDGRLVRLAGLVGRKPVVLIFGTFTCGLFCQELNGLRELHERFKDEVEFLFVYGDNTPYRLPEALDAVLKAQGMSVNSPEGRRLAARKGVRQFDLPFRCVIDGEDRAVTKAYGAWPLRLFIVNRAGRIAFDSGNGIPPTLQVQQAQAWLKAYVRPR
jgi:peroxiredoxin